MKSIPLLSVCSRRDFLARTGAIAATALLKPGAVASSLVAAPKRPTVMTVRGNLAAAKLGIALTHEHVLVDFVGAEKIGPGRYEREDAFLRILPHLKELRGLGCRTLMECTPAYLGRDPELLRRLAKASGLNILTNTGYYGAAENKYLPKHAFTETADDLARRWTTEFSDGIDGAGIRPGFIKIGVGGNTLSELHQRLVRAAARTHLATGLTIASHTGAATLAEEQVQILRSEGVHPSAFIFVHAQGESDLQRSLDLATSGCWISYDGYHPSNTARYVEAAGRLRDAGRLGQLLVSHDAGWYRPGEANGGEFRPFRDIFEGLLPALRQNGFTSAEINQLLIHNPANAFALNIRRL